MSRRDQGAAAVYEHRPSSLPKASVGENDGDGGLGLLALLQGVRLELLEVAVGGPPVPVGEERRDGRLYVDQVPYIGEGGSGVCYLYRGVG